MKFSLLFISIFFISFLNNCEAQNIGKEKLEKIDRLAFKINENDISKTVKELVSISKNDVEKVRAIYAWIASHVTYDVNKLQEMTTNESKRYSYETESQIAINTFNRKSAVCHGYAILFNDMCKKANVETQIINGITKRFDIQMYENDSLVSNHSWNAVKLDNEWKFIDVTWASGYLDVGYKKFTKSFDSSYFLSEPNEFILNHFPIDKNLQLLNKKITLKEFINYPFIYGKFSSSGISTFSPKERVLIISKKNPIIKIKLELKQAVPNNKSTLYTLQQLKKDGEFNGTQNVDLGDLPKAKTINNKSNVYLISKIKKDTKFLEIFYMFDATIRYELKWTE